VAQPNLSVVVRLTLAGSVAEFRARLLSLGVEAKENKTKAGITKDFCQDRAKRVRARARVFAEKISAEMTDLSGTTNNNAVYNSGK